MADMRLPAILETTHELHERGGVVVLVRRDWASALPSDRLLGGAPLTEWGQAVPHALAGRGPVHVLRTARGEIVAKRLLRGGAAGSVLRGWFGDPRRPLREAEAAERLIQRGALTPPVVAVRTVRGAFGLHRIEIATERIASRGELLDVLRARGGELTRLAALAGRGLRQLHDAGLRHRDLNARNLLVPLDAPAGAPRASSGLVVLDLDRCSVGEPLTDDERIASLARLARSLLKHRVLPTRRGEDTAAVRACRAFFAGYGALRSTRRAMVCAAVAERVRRTLVLHPWSWFVPR